MPLAAGIPPATLGGNATESVESWGHGSVAFDNDGTTPYRTRTPWEGTIGQYPAGELSGTFGIRPVPPILFGTRGSAGSRGVAGSVFGTFWLGTNPDRLAVAVEPHAELGFLFLALSAGVAFGTPAARMHLRGGLVSANAEWTGWTRTGSFR